MRLLLLLLTLVSGLAAQTIKPAAVIKTGTSDAAIEQEIKARLAKSKLSADKFTVKVHNGVATWEGKTDVIQHKGAATRMAKSAGARQVINQIQITEAAKQKAAANLEKGRKKAELKRTQVVATKK